MPNTRSAERELRRARRRTAINRIRRTRMRTKIKQVRKLLDEKNVEAAEALLPEAYSIIDRAAKWGIIKKNTAARYKSRLAQRLAKVKQELAAQAAS